MAYSPLGRGFLTSNNEVRTPTDDQDFRRFQPRFSGENLEKNARLVDALAEIAASKGVSVAQLSLAWVLAQGNDVVPIPGTKRRKWLRENIGASDLTLSDDDVAQLTRAVPREAVSGDRYYAAAMKTING